MQQQCRCCRRWPPPSAAPPAPGCGLGSTPAVAVCRAGRPWPIASPAPVGACGRGGSRRRATLRVGHPRWPHWCRCRLLGQGGQGAGEGEIAVQVGHCRRAPCSQGRKLTPAQQSVSDSLLPAAAAAQVVEGQNECMLQQRRELSSTMHRYRSASGSAVLAHPSLSLLTLAQPICSEASVAPLCESSMSHWRTSGARPLCCAAAQASTVCSAPAASPGLRMSAAAATT